MKSIYIKDLKAMLQEEEFFSIEQEISEINEIGFSENLNFILQSGTDWQIKKDGIKKMLKYFACKIIKNNRTNNFSEVCQNIEKLLGTSNYNVARWLKGMRDSFIIADQFDQNYIEII